MTSKHAMPQISRAAILQNGVCKQDSSEHAPKLSGHYSRDWSKDVNVIGAISESFTREFR